MKMVTGWPAPPTTGVLNTVGPCNTHALVVGMVPLAPTTNVAPPFTLAATAYAPGPVPVLRVPNWMDVTDTV